MKNKFILEEVNRIHEIMGTSPKKLIKEGVDELAPFVARFIQKLTNEAPDIADDLFAQVQRNSTQFADDLTTAGITNMEQLLAKGTNDMLFDFFLNMNSLRLLDDVVVDTLLAMSKSGDAFVGPLINDIDKIVAAGAPDAIDSAKAATKAAGFSDNVVEQLFARAPIYAQKIIQMTPELINSLTDFIMQALAKIQNTASFKALPKELQERLTLNYTSMTDDIIKRYFGQNPSLSSIQAAMFKDIDDLAIQAKNMPTVTWGTKLSTQITEMKKVIKSVLPSQEFALKTVLRLLVGMVALAIARKIIGIVNSGEVGQESGEGLGEFIDGLMDGATGQSGNTQDQSQNQNQNQNQNQQPTPRPKKSIDDY